MSTIRYTLSFTRAETGTVSSTSPSTVSVVVPAEGANFETAARYAEALLPQGPVWKAPFLVSAIESDD